MGRLHESISTLRRAATEIRLGVLRRKFGIALVLISCNGVSQVNHLEAAVELLNQGHLEQAEAEARRVLKDPTARPVALAMLGTIRLREGKYQESESFLSQALKLKPELIGARTNLGETYLLEGRPKDARASFQEALRRDPTNFNARFDLAKVESSLLDFQKSLDAAAPIMPRLRQSDDGILMLATDYGALGKKAELAKLFDDWQRLAGPSDEASINFAGLLAGYGVKDRAREILGAEEEKVDANPSAALALQVGKGYWSLADLEKAEKNSERALSLDPNCTACDLILAQIAEQQGITEKALSYLLPAKKREPENPEVLFEFGKVCLQRDLLDDALPALEKAVELQPDRDAYVYTLASADVGRGNLAKAASLLTGLLQKHPKDAALNYALGTVYYLQAKYPEAEASLKKSLAAQPDQVATSYYLSLTYDATGDVDKAVPLLRDVIKKHPEHAPSYVKLGSILARQQHYVEADQVLRRAVELDPASVPAHYQLGMVLRHLGKTAESEEQLAQWRKLQTEEQSQHEKHLRLLLPD